MGLLQKLINKRPPTAPLAIRSPWSGTSAGLKEIALWQAIAGTDNQNGPVTRMEAMRTPAIAKGRNLLVGQISRCPLVALAPHETIETSQTVTPTWLQTAPPEHPTAWHRMAHTIDDLIFNGWALWAVERDTDGNITAAIRVPPENWSFDTDGNVLVDGSPAQARDVILFEGPFEGLLACAPETIRAAARLEKAWASRVQIPIPVVELHETTDMLRTDNEIDALIDGYVIARNDPDGAVIYTPQDVDLRVHGEAKADVLVEARNAIRLDIANFMGLPAEILDGSLSTASLTYTTQQGTRTELGDALRTWTEPIAARLSQDDVVPSPLRVRFDMTDLEAVPIEPSGTQTVD